jgi:hypothetical protein
MRLSSTVASYLDRGSIVDRLQYTASGGEITFPLTFTQDNEEVYLNGIRLFSGASEDYTASNGSITLSTPLAEGAKLLLIGRASAGGISFSAARTERVELSDGQLVVDLQQVTTEGTEYYISGVNADNTLLSSPRDYTTTSESSITLSTSYPAGTTLEVYQGQRSAWPDPNTYLIDDGSKVESLSSRFSKIKEGYQYFIETESRQLQELHVGETIQKWVVNNGVPVVNTSGVYPAILHESAIWLLDDNLTGNYAITGWSVVSNTLSISTDRGVINAYRKVGGLDAPTIGVPDATEQDLIDKISIPRIFTPEQIYSVAEYYRLSNLRQLYEISGYAIASRLVIDLPVAASEIELIIDGRLQSSSGYTATRNDDYDITRVAIEGLSGGEFVLVKFRESIGGSALNVPVVYPLDSVSVPNTVNTEGAVFYDTEPLLYDTDVLLYWE